MLKKPANLVYGVEENPPLWVTTLSGLQHVFIMSVYFVFPVIIVNSIQGSDEQAAMMIKMSMVAMGVTSVLQALHKGPLGSGYLCPSGNGPAYLSSEILAAQTGGLSLVFGMTIIGGVFEALFSRIIPRLRALIPPEVAGLVVLMVGIELIPLGITRFLGITGSNAAIHSNDLIIALVTYGSMLGLNIWGKGKVRLFPILIGMVIGYMLSFIFGTSDAPHIQKILQAPIIALPEFCSAGWSFDMSLLLPFIIATICSSLKDVGDLTMCQKINDSAWKRPDMKSISKGILADSMGDILSGLIGGLGQSTSSSNVGVSLATGATSRSIAYSIGAILCLLAFFPKFAMIFVIMPKPVMGAVLIFVANFMILAGIQIITTRMIDARKTFVIGTALIFGLSVYLFPDLYRNVPHLIRPVFGSALSFGAILAITLNLIFRIGIRKKVQLEIVPGVDGTEKIFNFMDRQGGLWGARKEVISQVTAALSEFLEAVSEHRLAQQPMHIDMSFDEFNLDVDIRYQGKPLEFPSERPDLDKVLDDSRTALIFSGFLIEHYADKIITHTENDHHHLHLHFMH